MQSIQFSNVYCTVIKFQGCASAICLDILRGCKENHSLVYFDETDHVGGGKGSMVYFAAVNANKAERNERMRGGKLTTVCLKSVTPQ